MMRQVGIRDALEQALKSRITDAMMKYLTELGYIDDVKWDLKDINDLADIVRSIKRAAGDSAGGIKNPDMLSSGNISKESIPTARLRSQALSILLAKEAEKEPEVQAFRQEVLGGNLLDVDQIENWVRSQAESDGPETIWLRVPVRYDSEGRITTRSISGAGNSSWGLEMKKVVPGDVKPEEILGDVEVRYIEYSVPGGEWAKLQGTASGGVLERLWRISRFPLASNYPWTTAQATMFVLTGLYPEVSGIEAQSVMPKPVKAATRISLVIDPTVTPDEVRDEYHRLRQQLLVGRHKTRSDKHLRLAAFIAERPDTESWQDRMLAWNKAYPESGFKGYEYSHRSNFTRDARRVCQDLLNPAYRFSWAQLDPDRARFLSGDGG